MWITLKNGILKWRIKANKMRKSKLFGPKVIELVKKWIPRKKELKKLIEIKDEKK